MSASGSSGAAERRRPWDSGRHGTVLVSGRGEPKTDRITGEQVYALPRGPHSKPKAKMIYRGMIFHDTRRTSARNLVHAGVPEKVAMAIGGWKTRSVFNRYTIVSPRDVVEAGRKLEFSHSQKVGDKSGTIDASVHQVEMQPN
jgi:hypothetical protein